MDDKASSQTTQESDSKKTPERIKLSEGTFLEELNEAEELEIVNANPKEFQSHAIYKAKQVAEDYESAVYNAISRELKTREIFSDKNLIDKNERKGILNKQFNEAFDAMIKTRLDYEFNVMQQNFESYIDTRLKKRFHELLNNHNKILEQQGYVVTPDALEEQGMTSLNEFIKNDEKASGDGEKKRKEDSNIIVKSSNAMMSLLEVYRKMPKDIKPSFGKVWVETYIQFFLSLTKAYKMYTKESSLKNADMYLFQYNQLTEALYKNKLISAKESNIIIQQSNELGRMLGGWIRAEKGKTKKKGDN